MMTKVKLTKKIATWLMCLALILVNVNLPAFGLVAMASDGSISYIDELGRNQCVDEVTEVTNETTPWSNGWYVVSGNVNIYGRIYVDGNVNLILCDDSYLYISQGICVPDGASLSIYAQTEDEATMGELETKTTREYHAAIGSDAGGSGGDVTINGGKITASGCKGAGIGSGDGDINSITINGGIIDARDSEDTWKSSAGIGCGETGKVNSITINGGIINTTGIGKGYWGEGNTQISIHDTVKLIDICPNQIGLTIGSGDRAFGTTTVSFMSATEEVTGKGKTDAFYDEIKDGHRIVRGKDVNHKVTIDEASASDLTVNTEYAYAGETVTLAAGPSVNTAFLKVNDGDVSLSDEGNGKYSFVMPNVDVNVTAIVEETYSVTLPENMEIVSSTNAANRDGRYTSGTVVCFKECFPFMAAGVSNGIENLLRENGVFSVEIWDCDVNISADLFRQAPIVLDDAPGDFEAMDKDVLVGETEYTVMIADDAKVTLSGAKIKGGIVCEGSATINLVGNNEVIYTKREDELNAISGPGIQVGGEDTTLIIMGDGSLAVEGSFDSPGIGISYSSERDIIGGDIIIEGGNIFSFGSVRGAAIGTGEHKNGRKQTLGNITIKGGKVYALGDYDITGGNGIGYGANSREHGDQIGLITICDTAELVYATSILGNVEYLHIEDDAPVGVTDEVNDYFSVGIDGSKIVVSSLKCEGKGGDSLSSISLPAEFEWENPDEIIICDSTEEQSLNPRSAVFKISKVSPRVGREVTAEIDSVIRIIAEHAYSSDCDSTCAFCGAERIPVGSHDFSDDGTCVCGAVPVSYTIARVGEADCAIITGPNTDSYVDSTGDLIIPSVIRENGQEFPVTVIESRAFFECDYTGKLVIPDTVKRIYDEAFCGTAFTGDLVIPDSVLSISGRAFASCGFDGKLTLSNSLTCIEEGTFMVCPLTGTLTIPEGVTYIGQSAFDGTEFSGDLVIPGSVEIIDGHAFTGSKFDGTLTIEDGVEEIENRAFSGCKFTGDVKIPDSVKYVGEAVFERCESIERILLPCSSDFDEILDNGVASIEHVPHDFSNDGTCACGAIQVTYSTFPDDNLEYYAAITGPNTSTDMTGDLIIPSIIKSGENEYPVRVISASAFTDCGYKGKLVIPEGVTTIEDMAFGNAEFTGELIIPDSVTTIGRGAFDGNDFSGDLIIPDSVTSIGAGAFSNCAFDGTLTISKNLTRIEASTFDGCPFTGTLTIPEGVEYIGNKAFADCKFTGDVVIPASVQTVGEKVFNLCSTIKNIKVPCSLDSYELLANGYSKVVSDKHDFEDEYGESDSTKEKCSLCGKKNIAYEGIEVCEEDPYYTGSDVTPAIEVKDGENELTLDADYTIEVTAETNVSSTGYELYIIGKGDYAGKRLDYWNVGRIDPTSADFLYVMPEGEVYTGDSVPVEVIANPQVGTGLGEVRVKYVEKDGSENDLTPDAPVNAGDYDVYAQVFVGTNYYAGNVKLGSFTIAKADPGFVDSPYATIDNIKDYSITLSVLNDGRTYMFKCDDGEWQDSPEFTGLTPNTTYTFYQKSLESKNYLESASSAGYEITTTKIQPVFTEEPRLEGVYGSNLYAMLVEGITEVPGTYDFISSDDVPQVGTEETYTVRFIPDDDETYGYVVFNLTPVVAKYPVALDWSGEFESNYDGNAHGVSATISNIIGTDEVNVVLSDESRIAAGEYTATATGLSGAACNNYTLEGGENLSADYSILPMEIDNSNTEITLGASLTYTGSEQTQSVTDVVIAGTGLSVTYTVSDNKQTAAGDGYVLTVTGTGNFTGTATKTYSIAKATAIANAPGTAKSVCIKAEEQPITNVTLPEGWEWEDENITLPTTVGEKVHATAAYAAEDADNYEDAAKSVTVEITMAECEHPADKIIDEVEVPADCTHVGLINRVCSECGAVVEDRIFTPEKGHTPAEAVREDEVPATCLEAGSYKLVVKCVVCDEIISSENVTVPALGHSFDEGRIVREATPGNTGLKEYTCTRDNTHKRTEIIPALPVEENHADDSHSNESHSNEAPSNETASNEAPSNGTASNENAPVSEQTPAQSQAPAPNQAPLQAPASIEEVPATAPTQLAASKGPKLVGKAGTEGWDAIASYVEKTDKEAVTVDMDGETTVPGSVFGKLKGKDVTVTFDLGNGITWTVNGQDVTSDNIGEINLGVKTGVNAKKIPVEVLNALTGEKTSVELSLEYEGEFGFKAVLTVNVDKKNAGLYANLFYYNREANALELIDAVKVDENGNAGLTFTHASEYSIVLADHVMNENEEKIEEADSTSGAAEAISQAEGEALSEDAMSEQTSNGKVLWIVIAIVLVLIAAGVVYFAVYSKKKNDSNN